MNEDENWSQLYRHLHEALAQVEAEMGAAEGHGLLCGLLCVSDQLDTRTWVDALGDVDAGSAHGSRAVAVAGEVFEETARRIDSDDMTFQPLVPDDDERMLERSRALAAWCQGFLYGLGTGGASVEGRLGDDAREMLADLADISRMAPEPGDGSAKEEDYAHVLEYVRVGAILLYTELRHRGEQRH